MNKVNCFDCGTETEKTKGKTFDGNHRCSSCQYNSMRQRDAERAIKSGKKFRRNCHDCGKEVLTQFSPEERTLPFCGKCGGKRKYRRISLEDTFKFRW
jgi:hypothetical protein